MSNAKWVNHYVVKCRNCNVVYTSLLPHYKGSKCGQCHTHNSHNDYIGYNAVKKLKGGS